MAARGAVRGRLPALQLRPMQVPAKRMAASCLAWLKLSRQCCVVLLQTWSTCSWRSSTSVGGVGVGGWLAACLLQVCAHSCPKLLQPIVQLVSQRARRLLLMLIVHHTWFVLPCSGHRIEQLSAACSPTSSSVPTTDSQSPSD